MHRYLSLGRSPFPLRHIAEGVTPRPQGVPLISHLTAYSCQLTAYREFAAPRHPSCGFAAARLTKKECALLGRLSAFCIKAKLGSPMQDFHLQGPAYWGLPQLSRIPVTIHISAAKPLSNLTPPVRSICSPVGPAKRRPTHHPYAPSRHPTTADAVPLPSKEGRFTVYKRRRFPTCAPPPPFLIRH